MIQIIKTTTQIKVIIKTTEKMAMVTRRPPPVLSLASSILPVGKCKHIIYGLVLHSHTDLSFKLDGKRSGYFTIYFYVQNLRECHNWHYSDVIGNSRKLFKSIVGYVI